ncbi:DUF6232 family protein [Micromonospora sp. PTRAS2]
MNPAENDRDYLEDGSTFDPLAEALEENAPALQRFLLSVDAVASEFLTEEKIAKNLARVKDGGPGNAAPPPETWPWTARSQAGARAVPDTAWRTDPIAANAEPPRPLSPGYARLRGNRCYYRAHDVRVTSLFVSLSGQRYDLDDLDDFRVARQPIRPPLLTIPLITAVWLLPLPWQGHSVWVAVGVAVALTAFVLSWLLWRRRQRSYELWARYRGLTVQVFWSTDEETFTELCQAILAAKGDRPGQQPAVPPAARQPARGRLAAMVRTLPLTSGPRPLPHGTRVG